MSAFFWTLLGANGVFAVLIFAALPWGPDLLYAIQAGSLLGAVFMLGWKERERNGSIVSSSRPRNGVPSEGSPPFPPWTGR